MQSLDRYLRAGFLKRFAPRRFLCSFADFHEASRIRPQARLRFNRPPAQEDSALPFRDATRHDLGVMVVNGLARVAHEPGKIVAVWDSVRNGFAALAAKLHGHAAKKVSAHG